MDEESYIFGIRETKYCQYVYIDDSQDIVVEMTKEQREKWISKLKEKIEQLGGKVVGSISSKTDYLINNDKNSTSSKNIKAKQLNIPIISENDFEQMVEVKE